MAADVSSVARLLRGEAGKKGGPEIVTMDLLGGCGGGGGRAAEDEVVDLEVTVPAGWERRLDLLSGKTFLIPRHTSVQDGNQDLNMPPPASTAAAPTTSAAVCTLDMVRSALERATAGRPVASPATSSASSASTSSSSSAGKRNRSPPADAQALATPAMRAAACPSCLTYVLIAEADPRCPRCSARVPPLGGMSAAASGADGSGKKPRIDLNAAADESE
ncbi:protein CURLY FLAG LEAF 1-like [Phragmites australis]|uniref:protein CURLY FLAG LEAF 1-like n=1 Tax=Phragmites australis TaxID=29695 RepID=UPI002D773B42|nr:protein CURLY FLAG LEAF 1-like [Phragmites australis]